MLRSLAPALLVVALPAFAGGQAIMESRTHEREITTKLAWNDHGHTRFDAQGQQGYMLARHGKIYSVSNAEGRTIVMNLSSMSRMMSYSAAGAESGSVADARSVSRIEATGRRERVAGIDGKIHRITWTNAQGETRTDEAVLSAHPAVVGLADALRAFSEAMRKATGQHQPDALGQALERRDLGVLRFGERMRVTALSDEPPGANAFELPAEPMDMQRIIEGTRNDGRDPRSDPPSHPQSAPQSGP